ncbi:uncharacterized protein LOC110720090 [Chenopodium quinoa]|uniref:uncharacterized protein LOC110720090 n=1 Tax=Chenopodium quinoa TaxID=63459 RepID=UPI000B76D000|nr:uncharacterized protein LOC110720090 [Chenopodium quinoa]
MEGEASSSSSSSPDDFSAMLEIHIRELQQAKNGDAQKIILEKMKADIESFFQLGKLSSPNVKLLNPAYKALKFYYQECLSDSDLKIKLADMLSFLSTISCEDEEYECMHFKLLGSRTNEFTKWGTRYLKILGFQIRQTFRKFHVIAQQVKEYYQNRRGKSITNLLFFKGSTIQELQLKTVIVLQHASALSKNSFLMCNSVKEYKISMSASDGAEIMRYDPLFHGYKMMPKVRRGLAVFDAEVRAKRFLTSPTQTRIYILIQRENENFFIVKDDILEGIRALEDWLHKYYQDEDIKIAFLVFDHGHNLYYLRNKFWVARLIQGEDWWDE